MGWTEQRNRTFLDRYAAKDQRGNLLEQTPQAMWERVVETLAEDENEAAEFMDVLQGWKFVPGGRILSGLGAGQNVTLYNCFVVGVESGDPTLGNDSRAAIMETTAKMVEITSRGGGVGVNWATLRPAGTYIRGVNGRSSGAVAWASGVDSMIDKIRQGGTRTAALMYVLPDWHPDIEEFIDASFLRANHSILVSDAFMDAVKRDAMWGLVFPDTTDHDYDKEWAGDIRTWNHRRIGPRWVRARVLWEKMCRAVVQTGNPGLLFIDRAQEESNTGYFETYSATNPCGEQFLPVDGCCNLGSVNLTAHWDPHAHDVNWRDLRRTVRISTKLMDRIIDRSPDINPEIGDLQRRVRRVGIGAMGLADVLILGGIRYGSIGARAVAGDLYALIRNAAYYQSAELARLHGPAPAYSAEILDRPFMKRLPDDLRSQIKEHGLRNLTLTNQAPTGTTSIVAGASSGIEPIFADSYVRDDATGRTEVHHPLFRGERGPEHVTAHDLVIEDHIAMQAAVQPYLDNAISKTINAPAGSDWYDVGRAYQKAYESGCKGITVFVDGSRKGVLTLDEGQGRLSCGDECEIPILEHEEHTHS